MHAFARTEDDAEELAEFLTDIDRVEPVVVISTHHDAPMLDPDEVARRLGVEVRVITGADATRTLSGALPPGAGVYGECVRVYPGGADWLDRPYASQFISAAKASHLSSARVYSELEGFLWNTQRVMVETPALGSRVDAATKARLQAVARRVAEDRVARASVLPVPDDAPVAFTGQVWDTVSPAEAPPERADDGQEELRRLLHAAQAAEVRLRDQLQRQSMINQRLAREVSQLRRRAGVVGPSAGEELESMARAVHAAQSEAARWKEKERERREETRQLRLEVRRLQQDSGAPGPSEAARLRAEVHAAWERRLPEADKPHRPLAGYRFGPRFMDSVWALDGLDRDKLADVMMEVLTGLADALPGRAMHQYHAGEGGAEAVQHSELGHLWRANLQTNAASARRLHFYRGPGGVVTFVSVRVHDDAV